MQFYLQDKIIPLVIVDETDPKQSVITWDFDEKTPLHYAAETESSIEVIKALIVADNTGPKESVTVLNGLMRTPMRYAAESKSSY